MDWSISCVAQACDDTPVMSGAVGGVQTRFRQKHPGAIYVNSNTHKLNLFPCHTGKSCR